MPVAKGLIPQVNIYGSINLKCIKQGNSSLLTYTLNPLPLHVIADISDNETYKFLGIILIDSWVDDLPAFFKKIFL